MACRKMFPYIIIAIVLVLTTNTTFANNNPHHLSKDELLSFKEMILDGSMLLWHGETRRYSQFFSKGFLLLPTVSRFHKKNNSEKAPTFFEQIYKPVDPGLKGGCKVTASLRTSEISYKCKIQSKDSDENIKVRMTGRLIPEGSGDGRLVWSNSMGASTISSEVVYMNANYEGERGGHPITSQ